MPETEPKKRKEARKQPEVNKLDELQEWMREEELQLPAGPPLAPVSLSEVMDGTLSQQTQTTASFAPAEKIDDEQGEGAPSSGSGAARAVQPQTITAPALTMGKATFFIPRDVVWEALSAKTSNSHVYLSEENDEFLRHLAAAMRKTGKSVRTAGISSWANWSIAVVRYLLAAIGMSVDPNHDDPLAALCEETTRRSEAIRRDPTGAMGVLTDLVNEALKRGQEQTPEED